MFLKVGEKYHEKGSFGSETGCVSRYNRKRLYSLKAMLDILFEYAMLQSDDYPITMQSVDICGILYQVLSAYYDDFMIKGATPEIRLERESYFVCSDKNALIRIFENLVSNSLKHGKGNLSIQSHPQEGMSKPDLQMPRRIYRKTM